MVAGGLWRCAGLAHIPGTEEGRHSAGQVSAGHVVLISTIHELNSYYLGQF